MRNYFMYENKQRNKFVIEYLKLFATDRHWEEQYLFDHFGDCLVLKQIIFVLLMQFAEVLHSFLVIMKSFSGNKFLRLLEV